MKDATPESAQHAALVERGLPPWARHYPKLLLFFLAFVLWDVSRPITAWMFHADPQTGGPYTLLSTWMVEVLLAYVVWTLLLPIPMWASWRWRLDRRPFARMAAGHLLALAAYLALDLLLYRTARGCLLSSPPGAPLQEWLTHGLRTLTATQAAGTAWYALLYYGYVTLASHLLDFVREAREKSLLASRMETALSQAQLQTLKSQIQPHFLFNALANIHALISVDDAGAKRMVNLLSDFLRTSLQEAGTQLTTLEQELAFTDRYLEIQRVRFSNRLTVERIVDPTCLPLPVPHLLLQPLVENALKHGIAPSVGPATIRVEAAREGAALVLSVTDDGPSRLGSSAGVTPESTGLGLKNTAERLRQLYGGSATLNYGPTPDGQTWEVQVRLPLETT